MRPFFTLTTCAGILLLGTALSPGGLDTPTMEGIGRFILTTGLGLLTLLFVLVMISLSGVVGGIGARLAPHVVPNLPALLEEGQRTIEQHMRDLLEQATPTERYDPNTWTGHLGCLWSDQSFHISLHPHEHAWIASQRLKTSINPLAWVHARPTWSTLSTFQRAVAGHALMRQKWISTQPRYSAHERLAMHARLHAPTAHQPTICTLAFS